MIYSSAGKREKYQLERTQTSKWQKQKSSKTPVQKSKLNANVAYDQLFITKAGSMIAIYIYIYANLFRARHSHQSI